MLSRYVAQVYFKWLWNVSVCPCYYCCRFQFSHSTNDVFAFVRTLYYRTFSASTLITFVSPKIATSVNLYVPFSLSRNVMSGLLSGTVLTVSTNWFHNMVRGQLKCDGTRSETRFNLSAKRTSPFKSAGASVQSTTGSRSVRHQR